MGQGKRWRRRFHDAPGREVTAFDKKVDAQRCSTSGPRALLQATTCTRRRAKTIAGEWVPDLTGGLRHPPARHSCDGPTYMSRTSRRRSASAGAVPCTSRIRSTDASVSTTPGGHGQGRFPEHTGHTRPGPLDRVPVGVWVTSPGGTEGEPVSARRLLVVPVALVSAL